MKGGEEEEKGERELEGDGEKGGRDPGVPKAYKIL